MIIVQARMMSTRLPGKVLKLLAGKTVLAHVLDRCKAVDNADLICCAVADGADSDPVAAEAERCGVFVTRGSEDDVLDRYYQAAKALDAGVIMRVTSDCPLIDPEVCQRVLQLRADNDADFVCNNAPPSWPHGLDCEAFTMSALTQAATNAARKLEREHVSPWLRRNKHLRRMNLPGAGGDYVKMRWTLDSREDYEFFTALFDLLPESSGLVGHEEVARLWRAHPEVGAINAGCHDETRVVNEMSF